MLYFSLNYVRNNKITRTGKEISVALLRPRLHMTRVVHRASLVRNTSQRGCMIELTGQFPSHGKQPWAMAGGRAAGPLVSFPFKALCRVSSSR